MSEVAEKNTKSIVRLFAENKRQIVSFAGKVLLMGAGLGACLYVVHETDKFVKKFSPPQFSASIQDQLNNNVCLASATRDVVVDGRPVRIMVGGDVFQRFSLSSGDTDHVGTYALGYMTPSFFTLNKEKYIEKVHHTAIRPGDYDAEAAKKGVGCTPLDKLEL
ncbi:MAG: hypothetical protein EOM37_08575 [Proteobacteria bacterium]|jgi:hypothetical protein|nr:hypothetical protein [Alphaproteobacteria bacterium]NCC04081.1 hypothetical protein [Pseudomonadota bacterium]